MDGRSCGRTEHKRDDQPCLIYLHVISLVPYRPVASFAKLKASTQLSSTSSVVILDRLSFLSLRSVGSVRGDWEAIGRRSREAGNCRVGSHHHPMLSPVLPMSSAASSARCHVVLARVGSALPGELRSWISTGFTGTGMTSTGGGGRLGATADEVGTIRDAPASARPRGAV